MAYWLIVIIIAYLFFALAALGDKLVLAGPANSKAYVFYVGLLSILSVFLIPFTGIKIPTAGMFFLIALDAIIFYIALYFGFVAVEKFEVSRVAVTIGATQPIFIFFISWIFWGYQGMNFWGFIAFLFLFLGSIIISFDKRLEFKNRYLSLTLFASLMYSFDYVMSKYIFEYFSFWHGIIFKSIFLFLISVSLILIKKNRQEILKKNKNLEEKKSFGKLFLATQACGAGANVLQSFAIFLTPVGFLPLLNSLRGLQYIFLFLFTLFITCFFPKIIKEKISKKAIIRKTASIFLIVAGLIILLL
jgi:drug/metabolite transporter (DMT)-like permease